MSRFPCFSTTLFITALATFLTACAPTAREAFGPRLDQAHAQGLPMVIYAYGVPGTIAVGVSDRAVPVYIQFVVTSDITLKQVQFLFIGHAARGMPIRASDGRIQAVELYGPGPFRPGKNYEVNTFRVQPAGFPGSKVACVELVQVKLLYAGGHRETYGKQALQSLLLPPLRGECADQGPQLNRIYGGA